MHLCTAGGRGPRRTHSSRHWGAPDGGGEGRGSGGTAKPLSFQASALFRGPSLRVTLGPGRGVPSWSLPCSSAPALTGAGEGAEGVRRGCGGSSPFIPAHPRPSPSHAGRSLPSKPPPSAPLSPMHLAGVSSFLMQSWAPHPPHPPHPLHPPWRRRSPERVLHRAPAGQHC